MNYPPIELHFYNKQNEVIRTYKQDRITWRFLKKAVRMTDIKVADESNLEIIAGFVCEFYGHRFSKRKLLKYTDAAQLLAVSGQIIRRTLLIMKDNGVELPNVTAVAKK